MCDLAAVREQIVARVTAPTVEKAAESAADYALAASDGSLPFMVVRGLGQPDPARPGPARREYVPPLGNGLESGRARFAGAPDHVPRLPVR